MRQVVGASVRFPTVSLTSALLVVAGFWLLVLLRRADVRAFDADAPRLSRAFNEIPVAVVATVVILSAWLVSLIGTLLLAVAHLKGAGDVTARVSLSALSALVALAAARGCAVPLARLFPGAARPRGQGAARSAPYDPGSPRPRR